MKLSKNISFKEATRSQTAIRRGIDNSPSLEQLQAMQNVAEKVFQPVREYYGKPIRINSFLRVEELNLAIGGSKTSQHVKGEAIDIDTESDNEKLFNYIKDNLDFDQLINEYNYSWVHVSFKLHGENRKQVLKAIKHEGKTIYQNG